MYFPIRSWSLYKQGMNCPIKHLICKLSALPAAPRRHSQSSPWGLWGTPPSQAARVCVGIFLGRICRGICQISASPWLHRLSLAPRAPKPRRLQTERIARLAWGTKPPADGNHSLKIEKEILGLIATLLALLYSVAGAFRKRRGSLPKPGACVVVTSSQRGL